MMPIVAITVFLSTASLPPSVGEIPKVTSTKDCRAGDPVNLRLVGSRDELIQAFCATGWSPADPVTIRSGIRIGVSVVFNRPYPSAPVSDLYLFGRVQDLAFEQSAGRSARSRHHVRFWQAGCTGDGRTIWAGAATFDLRVGRSPATGKITHRIAADVDSERDNILADLSRAGRLADNHIAPHAEPRTGLNGEGDCYFTDGGIGEGVLSGCVSMPSFEMKRRFGRRR